MQRIEEAKIAAHVRAGASADTRIPRDSFTTACAQACPTEAIVFGDIKDPESRVSKIKKQDRNYRLLEYLNVNTRTSYLARIRNPNPKMPDAANIGVASIEEKPVMRLSIFEFHRMDAAPDSTGAINRRSSDFESSGRLREVPLVLNRRNFSWLTERISGVVRKSAPRWWWVALRSLQASRPSVFFVSATRFPPASAPGD